MTASQYFREVAVLPLLQAQAAVDEVQDGAA